MKSFSGKNSTPSATSFLTPFYTLPILFLVATLPFFSHPVEFAESAEVITDDSVSINDNTVIDDNLYIGAGRAHIFGDILKDTMVVSGQSVLAGDFTEDVMVLSGSSFSDGIFREDLRIIGPNVTVSGEVSGDLLIIGGNVLIEKSAELNGDVMIVAGSLVSKGQMNSDVKIISGTVEINGQVSGDATITTQRMVFGPTANIDGRVSYFSPKKVISSNGAVITGPVVYNQISGIRESQLVERAILNFFNFWLVLKFITTLVIAFLLIYIFKYFSQQIALISKKSFLKMFFIGLLSLIIIPLVALVFGISLFALPVGIILILLYMVVLFISPAISGIIVGFLVWRFAKPKNDTVVSFQTATIGVVILTLLQFVPYIGELVQLVFFIVSFGAVHYYILQRIKGNL